MVGEPNVESCDLELPQTKINHVFAADANLEGR